MKLDNVQIKHFRNIEDLTFLPNKKLNVFVGKNGSGKSSILEALHYLGFARSFRTSKHRNVIKNSEAGFSVFCSVDDGDKKYGIHRLLDDTCTVNVNGRKSKRITDLVSQLPVQIFTPQSSDLLLGAPKLRRRYTDWLLFHVEHQFNLQSQVCNKALKHLNSLYKNRSNGNDVDYWYQLYSTKGELISEYRQKLISEHLTDLIKSNLKEFLPEFSFEISYYRGWEKELNLYDSLIKNREKDQKYGYVSVGPHKADIKIKCNGLAVQELLSRGQLRMLVAAMQLAQTQHLNNVTNKTSIFLLDDIGAELDELKREVFINRLNNSNSQLFVTAISINQLDFLNNYNEKTVFHVEHGQVREEIY